jgi:quinol monooxygenase YgiN
MIHVLAIITAKPGQRGALLQAFKAIVPTVHAEAGCIEYGPAVDVDGADPAFGPDTFVVVEKWESLDALKRMRLRPT